jgi:AAA domain/Bifunctional DNA primase/polymerase, N-terminal
MTLTASSSAIIIPLRTQARGSSWNPKWTPAARQALLKNGYEPTPLVGKRPVLDQWQNSRPTAEDITAWERTHPTATNTGILTRLVPAVDDDVLDPAVADTVYQWVKELIPPTCPELLRYGRYPKRAALFRCDKPFPKISTGKWIDQKGIEHQLEILCDGQQLVVYGTHPDTNEAYIWPGARPGRTPRISLPLLTPEAAQSLVNRAKALFQERGWRPKREERPKDSPRARGFERSDSFAHKIALGLADRIESLCRELLPKGRIDGRNWAVGDINGAPGQSLKVCLVGENRGLWLDFADEGWRGDALDLVEAVKNLRSVEAMEWSCRWLGWEWPSKRENSSEWRDESKAAPDNQQQSAAAGSLSNFAFMSDDTPSPQKILIDAVMPLEGLPFIGGQSSAGKTFIAILIAVCAASGRPLFGHEVKERVGSVMVAAEGKGMLRARIAAAMKELGVEGDIPVAWVKQVPDFNRPEGLQAFVRDLRAISEHFKTKFGVRLGLVFVDTVSASFDIKEEADNAEAARVCKVMRRIGDAIAALVVPIHHYGKNAGVGLRGASAWRANADFVLSVMADIDPQTGNVSNRQLAIAKDRDGAQGPLTAFTLKPIDLGVDDSGRPWGSLVAVAGISAGKPASDWPPSLSVFRQALQTALADGAFEAQPFADGPTLRVVFLHLVRDEFAKITHVDSDNEKGRQEAIRKQFTRRLADAQSKRLVGVRARDDGKTLIWLVSRQEPPQ